MNLVIGVPARRSPELVEWAKEGDPDPYAPDSYKFLLSKIKILPQFTNETSPKIPKLSQVLS